MEEDFVRPFFLFGEEISIPCGTFENALNIANIISLLNILGKPYYDELIKQGIILEDEIENVIKKRF